MSALPSALADSFLADLCDRAPELRHLGLCLSAHGAQTHKPAPVSADLLVAVVQLCPSLAQLYLTTPSEGRTMESADLDLVVDTVRQYHGGFCHRRDVTLLSANWRQIQLTFTPLKLIPVVATRPYLT